VVFVTHDLDEAFLLGDQVVILEKGGRIAQQGTPAEILANPASDFVASFIGAERGKRALSLITVNGAQVLIDGDGNPAGRLVEAGPA
jgi:osmoprotectant transport system ATP-binding protein